MNGKLHKQIAVFAGILGTATPALARVPEAPAPIYREGEVIVQYRHGTPLDLVRSVRSRYGLVPTRSLLDGRAELATLPRFTTVAGAIAALSAEPAVEHAEPNLRRYARSYIPTDPLFGQQWGLRNTGQANFVAGGTGGTPGGDLNMIHAWDANEDGTPDRLGDPAAIVAVIDDAILVSHPDFTANIVAPHNFVPCQNSNDVEPISPAGAHGTMTSGCIAARPGNGIGVAGVAPGASLMPLKFGFDEATHLQALAWARDHGAKVINASFGGPGYSQTEVDAIAALQANDILYVAAGGNDNSNTDLSQLNYPANFPADNIVAVAATNRQDNIASFSQYGPLTIDVAAPGLQIVTTTFDPGYSTAPGVAGTSFSSPYAAGVATLLRSYVLPPPGWREMKARLIESGSQAPGATNKQRTTGGRVDADLALDMAPRPSLVIKGVTFDDGAGNHVPDPGETLDVVFVIRNIWMPSGAVTASLAADNGVTVVSGPQALGTIAADGEATARFQVTMPSATDHRYITYTLSLGDDAGYAATRSYLHELGTLVAGTPQTSSFPGGASYDEFHAWHVDVPPFAGPGNRTLIVRTHTHAAGTDMDLLAKAGAPPQYDITLGATPESSGNFCTSGTTLDCRDPATEVSGREDGEEAITVENPAAGPWHLVVVNFAQVADSYDLTASLANGDLRPDPFDFPDVSNVNQNTTVTSNAVTLTGFDQPTFIYVTGGSYSINSGSFTTAEGLVQPNDKVKVRVTTSSGSTGAQAHAQLTVGGVTSDFRVNPPGFTPGSNEELACTTSGGGGGGTRGLNPGGGGLPPLTLALLLAGALGRRFIQRRT